MEEITSKANLRDIHIQVEAETLDRWKKKAKDLGYRSFSSFLREAIAEKLGETYIDPKVQKILGQLPESYRNQILEK